MSRTLVQLHRTAVTHFPSEAVSVSMSSSTAEQANSPSAVVDVEANAGQREAATVTAEPVDHTRSSTLTETPEATAVLHQVHHAEATAVVAQPEDDDIAVAAVNAEPIQGDLEAGTANLSSSGGEGARGRAEFISVTICKSQADMVLGISLEKNSDNGQVRVTELLPDGIFSRSPLRVGDFVMSVNGKSCLEMEAGQVDGLLRMMTGTITIVAQNIGGNSNLVETMVEKPSPDALVGLSLRRNAREKLEICRVRADGLFAHSLLVSELVIWIKPGARHLPSLTLRCVDAIRIN